MKDTDADHPQGFHVATVSPKGQITIPVALMRHFGWQPGTTRVLLTPRGDRLAVRVMTRTIVEQTAGSLARFVAPDRRGNTGTRR